MVKEDMGVDPQEEPPNTGFGELRSSFEAALSSFAPAKSEKAKEGKQKLWSIFDSLTERLISQEAEIKVLKGRLEERKSSQPTQTKSKTWASVVKGPPPQKPAEAKKVVLVYPKTGKDLTSEEVKKKLQSGLDPAKIKITVTKIRKVNHGGVMVELEKEAQAGRLTEAISGNPELADLAPRPPRRKQPRVVIYGVSNECSKDELKKQLTRHNEFLEGNFELLFPMKGKNGKSHWVAQVTPACLSKLKKRGKVGLLWEVHSVREYIRETRCFKCCGFGHFQAKCPESEQICARCAEAGHRHKECKAEKPKCRNCTIANSKRKEKLETAHSSLDRKCPCVVREVARVKNHIQYD